MISRAQLIRHYPVGLALIGPAAVAALMIPLRTHVLNTDLALIMVVIVALWSCPATGWRRSSRGCPPAYGSISS